MWIEVVTKILSQEIDPRIAGHVDRNFCCPGEAAEGARIIILNRLAVIRDAVGSLDKIKQIVALNGFVNSEPDFYGHPQVINGASELLIEIFGDKGKHSRTALGAAALPLNVAVEINLIVEIED